LSVVFYPISTA